MKYLPMIQKHRLAILYNCIETQYVWPKGTLLARAVFLHKPGTDPNNMSNYRVLIITSQTYRLWANTRSKQLDKCAPA